MLGLLVAATVGCATGSTAPSMTSVRELAGAWRGRLALGPANALATLTIRDDGGYAGALHVDGSEDRPFGGTIVIVRPGRLRYLGTHGDGTVVVGYESDGAAVVRFVPDGGGGGGSFTRAR